jgi:hypothetical protein
MNKGKETETKKLKTHLKAERRKSQLGIMERKNTPRPRLLIFLSTLHDSAVHNIAFNGPASLPDKDVEPAVNRQGWVNVPCTSTVK